MLAEACVDTLEVFFLSYTHAGQHFGERFRHGCNKASARIRRCSASAAGAPASSAASTWTEKRRPA